MDMFRTQQQRRDLCQKCPVARVADILGDSCTLLILRDLLDKPCRFSDFENSLSGISSRTLSNKLKRLEKDGLMVRKEFAGRMPHVKYALTKKGDALHDVIEAMRKYGKKYL